jgi:hypothetical protein
VAVFILFSFNSGGKAIVIMTDAVAVIGLHTLSFSNSVRQGSQTFIFTGLLSVVLTSSNFSQIGQRIALGIIASN